ncbi:MAG: alpha/beta fold hydrolase [Thiohalocapsa sp.]|uniref:esterase/lipase family protein n=1 Tax=Thiohalocapsa sp. TaxID=2497641 RepID=UPI0025D09997|nr:alpha/beta fold hydrolase [Thiohalocapsa sp.]MCG6941363.1 alpha/beta fold hydrolase [Thiohalocapsa sp.]
MSSTPTGGGRNAHKFTAAGAGHRCDAVPWVAAGMGRSKQGSWNRRRQPFTYTLFALILLTLVGCQSTSPLLQGRAAGNVPANAELAQSVAESIETLAQSRGQPEALARSEARHRRLLAGHLPQLLDDATPPRPTADVEGADALLDPEKLSRVTPVVRPRAKPAGLERAGIGLPVVARLPAPQDPNAPRAGYDLPATLVVQPGNSRRPPGANLFPERPATRQPETAPDMAIGMPGARSVCCETALVDPDAVAQVPTAASTLPVAMDLYAPLKATKATGIRPLAAIANLVRPGRFTGEPRIVFLRPFDADKTPVVLVHGLLSTPGIWEPLVTQLLADPRIRDCCQFWFFYYPTGQPVPLSALQLRSALDDAVANTGLTHKMILIGHSMGGILSRAQVSRISPTRAKKILPGVSELSDYNRVRRALIFEPRTDVSRVVFLFVPHRGSRLAANSLGALAIRLIQLPDTLLTEAEYALDHLAGQESRRLPTSIHGLSPHSRFLRALSATTPTVPVHSIIGNRGRGDGSAGSDGVVPVRSARVAGAKSELIVPTGHGGFDHPAAVAEIKRIILMDVAQQQASRGTPAEHDVAPTGRTKPLERANRMEKTSRIRPPGTSHINPRED